MRSANGIQVDLGDSMIDSCYEEAEILHSIPEKNSHENSNFKMEYGVLF